MPEGGVPANIQRCPVAAESRVLIIMTGGTICMKKSPNGFMPARGFLQSGMAPRPSFNDATGPEDIKVATSNGLLEAHRSLRTPLSTYDKHVRYAVFEFDKLLDSSSIDAEGWTQIAETVHRNYEFFDGFVVLHGTDSLAYTCSALSFMLQDLGKPVVLTGSQAPISELQNDATDNLLGSLIIAGHFMIPEVCLFFNYKLFRGNRATKTSATDFAAFASPNMLPLATVHSSKTVVNWELVYRPSEMRPFSIHTHRQTGHVACLRIFPGIKPEMVGAVLNLQGLKGLILETFGSGNAPGGPDGALTKVFEAAVNRGIVIINVTQCGSSLCLDIWSDDAHMPCRHDRYRKSSLRTCHAVETGRCGARTRHDDGSGPGQTILPSWARSIHQRHCSADGKYISELLCPKALSRES